MEYENGTAVCGDRQQGNLSKVLSVPHVDRGILQVCKDQISEPRYDRTVGGAEAADRDQEEIIPLI